MQFTITDRIMLNNLLPTLVPERSTRFVYKLLDDFAKDLSLSPKDIAYIELKVGGETFIDGNGEEVEVPQDSVRWNPAKTLEKKIDIPQTILTILTQNLQGLDERGELPQEATAVFDKFVGETQWFNEEPDEDDL